MIKEIMTEHGAFLNVIGTETYQKSGESRSITYNDVYNRLDSFYNFNSNMSNQLYTRLWGKFKKDKHSSIGLLKAVNKRKKLLDYLKKNKIDSYKNVLTKLNLRK